MTHGFCPICGAQVLEQLFCVPCQQNWKTVHPAVRTRFLLGIADHLRDMPERDNDFLRSAGVGITLESADYSEIPLLVTFDSLPTITLDENRTGDVSIIFNEGKPNAVELFFKNTPADMLPQYFEEQLIGELTGQD